MIEVWADTETKSELDLKKHGTYRYAEHPSTHIQLFSFAVGDGDVELWSLEDGEPMPVKLRALFDNPEVVFYFHNAWFDRNLIERCLGIILPIRRYRCVMAKALAHALPAGLEKLGEVMGLPQDLQKMKDGKRLVLKFCKPRKMKDGTLKWATPQTDPEDWALYKEYCKLDTASMRAAAKLIPQWNYVGRELEYWFMDQTVNSRGLPIDMHFVNSAVRVIETNQKRLSAQTKDLTDNEVQAASQRDAMLKHIAERYEIELPDFRKSTLEKLLESDDLHPTLRQLILIRLATSTTSTSKYKKFVDVTSADQRVRGVIQYYAASRTGRDGGRMVQPQNFTRPTEDHDVILAGIDTICKYSPDDAIDGFEMTGAKTMSVCSSALRYSIAAQKGKKFVIADLANIEGRVLAYLAGEEWKLEAFRQYDTILLDENGDVLLDKKGEPLRAGPDMYKASYGKSFSVSTDSVSKDQRQIGKVQELSLGYFGGVGAIVAFATGFNIDLHDLASKVRPTLSREVIEEAENFYDWLAKMNKSKPDFDFGLGKDTFVAIDCIKRAWRLGHPATVALWKDTEQAVRNAIDVPKKRFYFAGGKLYAIRSGKWIKIVLPSGHVLPYPMMEAFVDRKRADVDELSEEFDDGDTNRKGDGRSKLRFKGVHQFTKKWSWIHTYSGRLVENCFTGDTRILTDKGVIRIVDVTASHKVWDGDNWVETLGVSYRGKREVGTWLNVKVTSDHLIFDGKEWNCVQKLGEERTQSALSWALNSVTSLCEFQDYQRRVKRNVFALAEEKYALAMNPSAEGQQSHALAVLSRLIGRTKSFLDMFLRTSNITYGHTGILEWLEDALTRNVRNIKITVGEALRCVKNGGLIGKHSLNTQLHYLTGKTCLPIWTESTTIEGTNREISGLFLERLMLGTRGTTKLSNTKAAPCPTQSLSKSISLNGRAKTLFTTISKTADRSIGSWKSTTKAEKVYDLLNCGPRSRFTIITDFGPVIVHNCVQAFARDVFKHGQYLAEQAGYPVVLPVHDELVCEVPDSPEYNVHELERIMSIVPDWAPGLPLAAEGFEDYRYHK